MKCYHLLFGLIVSVLSIIAHGQTAPPAQTPAQKAFSDAQALVAGAKAGAAATIKNGGVAATVNQFNPTYYNSSGAAPESALFQGGKSIDAAVKAGQAKTADCQNGIPNPDPVLQQNCDAINMMLKNPSVRPQIAIPPSRFAASKQIVANAPALAAASLGIADPNAVGAFTGCVSKVVAPPPTNKVCNEFTGTAAQQCTVGRVVLADTFTNYKCDKTVDAYVPRPCDKTMNVTVTQPPPIAAISLKGLFFAVGIMGFGIDVGCPTANMPRYRLRCDTNGTIISACTFLSGTTIENGVKDPRCPAPPPPCPAGYTLSGTSCILPPVISKSITNGCTIQEAAAL